MELSDYDKASWEQLEKAVDDPDAPFRYLTVCSVDQNLHPQARTMVLRAASMETRELEFHTDVRSPKWRNSDRTNVQPFSDTAPSHGFNCALWEVLHRMHRLTARPICMVKAISLAKTNLCRRPTRRRARLRAAQVTSTNPESADSAKGQTYFGVLIFQAISLDRFQLQRQNNQRMLFQYDQSGSITSGNWVNP